MLDYLTELAGSRETCLAHAKSAAVGEELGLPCVRRRFRRSPVILNQLRCAVATLPGWRASLFFKAGQKGWQEIQHRAMHPHRAVLLCDGLSFEGLPFLLRVTANRAILTVDLILLPHPSDWPEHPLRTLDRMLRCHERLLPQAIRPLATSGWQRRGWKAVERYEKQLC